MKILKKIAQKNKFPLHAGNWEVFKICEGDSGNFENAYFSSTYTQTSMQRVEFFYKPIIRIILASNEND
mgnify:CR=1 FL=1|jgi:hypothetical protein